MEQSSEVVEIFQRHINSGNAIKNGGNAISVRN